MIWIDPDLEALQVRESWRRLASCCYLCWMVFPR